MLTIYLRPGVSLSIEADTGNLSRPSVVCVGAGFLRSAFMPLFGLLH